MPTNQGDIVLVSFDPSRGHEAMKTRPGVVISTTKFNIATSLTMVAPITSRDNGFPLHVPLPEVLDMEDGREAVRGVVCVEQARSLDLEARNARIIGRLGRSTMGRILTIIGAIYGI